MMQAVQTAVFTFGGISAPRSPSSYNKQNLGMEPIGLKRRI
jgi:hypothetical protein